MSNFKTVQSLFVHHYSNDLMHNLHIAWILPSRKTFFIKMFSVDKLLWNIVVITGWFIRFCSKRIKLLVQVVFLFFFKKTHSREACNLFTTFESLQQWWRLHQYCWQHPQSKQPHIVLLSIVHSRDEWVSWVFTWANPRLKKWKKNIFDSESSTLHGCLDVLKLHDLFTKLHIRAFIKKSATC